STLQLTQKQTFKLFPYTTLFRSYSETLEKQLEKESEVQRLHEKYEQDLQKMREETNQQFAQIMSMVQQNPRLAYIKPRHCKKRLDRKSTRLNSSHGSISYAVFCL